MSNPVISIHKPIIYEAVLTNKFLTRLKEEEIWCRIYLVSGIGLEGKIIDYDNEVIEIDSKKGSQYIYKANITSINPKQTMQEFDEMLD
jgi:RNA chaperone Hfq